MIDIAKGVLAGGWALLVGWLLPTAINVTLFIVLVIPSLQGKDYSAKAIEDAAGDAWLIIGVVIMAGLLLNALQTPLYRILEGYMFWPQWMHDLGRWLQGKRMGRLDKKITKLQTAINAGKSRSLRLAIIEERRALYPVDKNQVAPTRLGNSIRQFEEYSFNRYELDTQTLWYEISAVAPKEVSRQGDVARGAVDLFVCLLFGHILVSLAALGAALSGARNGGILWVTFAGLVVLARVWYQVACVSAAEWSATQQALANLGRRPLAKALGLELPEDILEERRMWRRVTLFVQDAYVEGRHDFSEFRGGMENIDEVEEVRISGAGLRKVRSGKIKKGS
ncbi:hypothetical protein F7R91_19805 [Streptomyces luteolifulvus]|uniref:Uncharacterized protein n=1 Tax=Streptomyces luteolifulvus TaxID=2615112 RepID=A0A6H9UXT6_9ACTN|nr:hypothetical protein [Streptomyces luteolifulvus]KAB1145411.1 hypothetical protein F7R91_19805 [Streptomyces luteolifulvus]